MSEVNETAAESLAAAEREATKTKLRVETLHRYTRADNPCGYAGFELIASGKSSGTAWFQSSTLDVLTIDDVLQIMRNRSRQWGYEVEDTQTEGNQ